MSWVDRWWWISLSWAHHPYACWLDLRHWLSRPYLGDKIIDCRYEIHTVARFAGTEDDLILDDGHAASWMHCCEHLPKSEKDLLRLLKEMNDGVGGADQPEIPA